MERNCSVGKRREKKAGVEKGREESLKEKILLYSICLPLFRAAEG
jgi:hypothetical protein